MRLSIHKTVEFVPEWNGNKEETEPIKFYLRYLTTQEADDIVTVAPVRDSEETGIQIDRIAMFRKAVDRIENLVVMNGSKEEHVTTAEKLLGTPGLADLMYEAIRFIFGMNAIDKKKSQ